MNEITKKLLTALLIVVIYIFVIIFFWDTRGDNNGKTHGGKRKVKYLKK
jgi:hypothetical protein